MKGKISYSESILYHLLSWAYLFLVPLACFECLGSRYFDMLLSTII